MTVRLLWAPLLLLLAAPLACSGETVPAGDGDSTGDGDSSGDGDSGDGDGPQIGDGDGDGPQINFGIIGDCQVDDDCFAIGVTSHACYSPGCEAPIAASATDITKNPCLVPWNGLEAVPATSECAYQWSGGDVACPGACAAPPSCIHAYCDAGTCALNTTYDGTDCTSPAMGGATGCAELDAARDAALERARACVPDGIAVECAAGTTVGNECGCPVVVNDASPDLIEAAEDARDAWRAACEPPMRCQLIDCADPGSDTYCSGDANSVGICSF